MLRVLLIVLIVALGIVLPADVDLSEAIVQEWVVVENGDYHLRVRAMDANLNQGLVCSVDVTVDNFLAGIE